MFHQQREDSTTTLMIVVMLSFQTNVRQSFHIRGDWCNVDREWERWFIIIICIQVQATRSTVNTTDDKKTPDHPGCNNFGTPSLFVETFPITSLSSGKDSKRYQERVWAELDAYTCHRWGMSFRFGGEVFPSICWYRNYRRWHCRVIVAQQRVL